ncbi:MAG: ROK family protein [Verrucomicrobiae bacterium]|nr:ROK family protein [Verrucomicrobiae bacterium]
MPLLEIIPPILPEIDPGFRPAILGNRHYVAEARKSGRAVPLILAVERENGLVSRHETVIFPAEDAAHFAETLRYVERLVKFLLWSRGGWRVMVGGAPHIAAELAKIYSPAGARRFDAEFMGRIYEKPFSVESRSPENIPDAKEMSMPLGGNLDGCRIGFDLGASDYKLSAVVDGQAVWTEEFPWNPREETDPGYHYRHLTAGLREAAAHLPRVDAIGGSSAGVIIGNRIRAASLFRSVPEAQFAAEVAGIFERIGREWNLPIAVANDGDVTALAGALSLRENAILGIAMGSSLAAGYLNPEGQITGWLNELAFAPVDHNPQAAPDEWSGDIGCGVQYFSQQGVMRLARQAGVVLDESLSVPERLKQVQSLMKEGGNPQVPKIYEAIGIALGYTLALYRDFYDYKHALILGRVTTGSGGDIIIARAREVLARGFPEMADPLHIVVPDEKSRRVGQAVAAASLPTR